MREKRISPIITENVNELDYNYSRNQKKGVFIKDSKVKIKGEDNFNLEFDIDEAMKIIPSVLNLIKNTVGNLVVSPINSLKDRRYEEDRPSRRSSRKERCTANKSKKDNLKRRFGTFQKNRRRVR